MRDRFEAISIFLAMLLGAIIGIVITSSYCKASDLMISAGGLSHHQDRAAGYRESNPGVLVEIREGDHSVVAGRFRNSFDRPSRIAAYRYRAVEYAGFGLGGAIGIVDGYPAGNGGPRPVAAPVASYDYGRVSLLVMAIPPVSKQISGWTAMVTVFAKAW